MCSNRGVRDFARGGRYRSDGFDGRPNRNVWRIKTFVSLQSSTHNIRTEFYCTNVFAPSDQLQVEGYLRDKSLTVMNFLDIHLKELIYILLQFSRKD